MTYEDIVSELVQISIDDSQEFGRDPEDHLYELLEGLTADCERELQKIVDPAWSSPQKSR